MRDFRDAKSMAQTLRESLTEKAVVISHGESLELVSRMLGVADWNTLSARLKADPRESAAQATPRRDGLIHYPAIPIRDLVPFPTMTFPLFIGREKTKQALDQAFAQRREVVLAVQKDADVNNPGFEDLYEVGTLATLMEVDRLQDDTMKVLVQVHRRVAISRFIGENGAFQAEISDISEGPIPDAPDLVANALARFKSHAAAHDLRIVATVPPLDQIRDPGRLADVIVSQLGVPLRTKQALLATLDPLERLERTHALMENAVAPPRSRAISATMDRALADARQRRHSHATLEHLLLALADDADAATVMRSCGVDLGALRRNLVGYIDTGLTRLLTEREAVPQPTAAFQRVTQRAGMQAWERQRPATTGADVLVALFTEWQSPAVQMLVQQQMTRKAALDVIMKEDVTRG